MSIPGAVPILVALVAVALRFLFPILQRLVLKPLATLRKLHAQGVRGYPFRPLLGNVPEFVRIEARRERDAEYAAATRGYEFSHEGTRKFGKVWSFCFGTEPCLVVTEPSMVRQALVTKAENFTKSPISKQLTVLGNGLVVSEGSLWARQRRLCNPAFEMAQVRRLFAAMAECAVDTVKEWQTVVTCQPGKPLLMDVQLAKLTLRIITTTAFGSNLPTEFADEIQAAFVEYLNTAPKAQMFSMVFPPYKYLPLSENRRMWQAEAFIRQAMKKIVSQRLQQHLDSSRKPQLTQNGTAQMNGTGSIAGIPAGDAKKTRVDLLDLLINSTEGLQASSQQEEGQAGPPKELVGAKASGIGMSEQQLIDECVTFLGGGFETSSVLLTWTMLLLSQHQEWQQKAREEVLAISSGPDWVPDFESLSQMKIVTCILHESLRIASPLALHLRMCIKETRLSDTLVVPVGCDVLAPVDVIHLSEELWGEDAKEFKPERFEGGVSKAAREPGAFMPFGLGPRICIGQNFAMVEAKLILAMLLLRFSWTVDESYKHHPVMSIAVKPKHGLPLILRPLDSP